MMTNGIKLSRWASQNGLTYKGAYRLFKAGQLPCTARQLPTGTIILYPEDTNRVTNLAVLYGCVSSHDQKSDLFRQIDRLRDFAAQNGFVIKYERVEIGSGLNGKRKGLLKILEDTTITHVLVEHRDRLARFGVEYLETALRASGRTLVVMNETESKMDLVQDFVDLATSMCARIYGNRSASRRALRAVQAASE